MRCTKISNALYFTVFTGIMAGLATAVHAQSLQFMPFVTGSADFPIVEVVVNENVKLNMLLDTGCSVCMITDTAAQRLGLKSFSRPIDGVIFRLHGKEVEAVNMTAAATWPTISGSPFYVVPTDDFHGMPVRLDGIVGISALRRNAILFDFAGRRIGISPTGRIDAKILADAKMQTRDTFTLPISATDQHVFKVKVGLNGSIINDMIVDTGSLATKLNPDVAEHLHSTSIGQIDSFPVFGSVVKGTGYGVDVLSLGPVKITGIKAFSAKDLPDYVPIDNIGLDVLRNFDLLFDFATDKVYIRRMEPPVLPADTYTWSPKYHAGQMFQVKRDFTIEGRFAGNKLHQSVQHDLLTYTVTKVDPDGTVLLSVVKHNEGAVIDGEHQPADPSLDNSFEQRFRADGSLIDDSRLNREEAFAAKVLVMIQDRRVPSKPVAVADKWQSNIPSLSDPGKQVAIDYLLYDAGSVSGTKALKIHFSSTMSLATSPRTAVWVEGESTVDPGTGYTSYRTTRVSNLDLTWPTEPGQVVKSVVQVTEQLIGKPDIPAAAPEKK